MNVIEGSGQIVPEPHWRMLLTDDLEIEAAAEYWRAVTTELRERDLLAPANRHAIQRLVLAYVIFDRSARDVAEHGAVTKPRRGNSKAIARLTVRRRADGELEYRWSEEGQSFVEGSRRVFHVRGFGGDPLGGLSTLAHGRNTFGIAQAIDKAASSTFRNGLHPTIAFKFDKFLTEEQRAVVDKDMAEKYVGARNAGRPMRLEGGASVEKLTINPEDAQMLESRAFSVEEICRIFGVPPFMVGHTVKSTSWGTGLEQQVLAFQKFTLRRRLKKIEQAIRKQLISPADRAAGITVSFNLEALLRGDSAARAAFYTAMLQSGVMTINEVRALEGLPPVAGGDVPRMQVQNQPITAARGIGDNGGPPLEDDDAEAEAA